MNQTLQNSNLLKLYLEFGPVMMRKLWRLLLLLGWMPVLTGCLTHTHTITRSRQAGVTLNASLDQLVKQVDERYDAIQSLNATVDIAASFYDTGKGQEKDFPDTRGYILLRKPAMLRVLGLVPVLHTRAFDMVSDGKDFTLLIAIKNKAITGSDAVTTPSKNSVENFRPKLFLDSILVRGVQPDEFVSLTTDTRVATSPGGKSGKDDKHKVTIEESDYNLTLTRRKGNTNQMTAVRVIHISRSNLLPYQQDIYNPDGNIVTQVVYGPYKDFAGAEFPSTVTIHRPLEKYSVTLTMQKLLVNQPLADDQFVLKLPEGTAVQKLP